MKAICTKRVFEYMGDKFFTVEEGEIITYTVEVNSRLEEFL